MPQTHDKNTIFIGVGLIVQAHPKANPPAATAFLSNEQHRSLIFWYFCLEQMAEALYSWLHVISGIVLLSACPPPQLL